MSKTKETTVQEEPLTTEEESEILAKDKIISDQSCATEFGSRALTKDTKFGQLTKGIVGDDKLVTFKTIDFTGKRREMIDNLMLKAWSKWEPYCHYTIEKVSKRSDALFIIRAATSDEEKQHKKTIADSFAPADLHKEVVLYRRFFDQKQKINVLIHEIGHILGFRHEHVWFSADLKKTERIKEDEVKGSAKLIGQLDLNSVMNYGQVYRLEKNNIEMDLSEEDKKCCELIYGEKKCSQCPKTITHCRVCELCGVFLCNKCRKKCPCCSESYCPEHICDVIECSCGVDKCMREDHDCDM